MLNPKKLGYAGGILGGLTMLIVTILAVASGCYGLEWLEGMKSLYPGYKISYLGSIVGMVYGLIDGFVFFYLLAWLYNRVKI